MAKRAHRLGYRIVNRNGSPSEPKQVVALDPPFQAAAEEILSSLAEKWREEPVRERA